MERLGEPGAGIVVKRVIKGSPNAAEPLLVTPEISLDVKLNSAAKPADAGTRTGTEKLQLPFAAKLPPDKESTVVPERLELTPQGLLGNGATGAKPLNTESRSTVNAMPFTASDSGFVRVKSRSICEPGMTELFGSKFISSSIDGLATTNSNRPELKVAVPPLMVALRALVLITVVPSAAPAGT